MSDEGRKITSVTTPVDPDQYGGTVPLSCFGQNVFGCVDIQEKAIFALTRVRCWDGATRIGAWWHIDGACIVRNAKNEVS